MLSKIPSKIAKFHLQILEHRPEFQPKVSPDVLRAGCRQQRGERAAELATLRQDLNALRQHNRLVGVEPQRPHDPRPTWPQEFDVKTTRSSDSVPLTG